MKFRTFLSILAALVLVLFGIGAGGAYWIAAHNPVSDLRLGQAARPTTALFVPKQAPIMASLLVNPDRLAASSIAVAPVDQRRKLRNEFDRLRRGLLAETQLDYRQDIQPWLGNEVTLAISAPDVDRETENGAQPGYLVIATTDDPALAESSLQTYWQRRAKTGLNLVFEQYAGVKLIYGVTAADRSVATDAAGLVPSLSTAVVGDRYVLFANYPKVLREAINNVQAADLSLSRSPAYEQALERLPQRTLGLTFINLPQFAVWLAGTGEKTDLVSAEPSYDSLMLTLDLDRQNWILDTFLAADTNRPLTPAQPTLRQPVGALRYVPAESPLVAAGKDVRTFWQQLDRELAGYKPLAARVQALRQSRESAWGVDLNQDLFEWMQGEYALAMLPRTDRAQPDWVFIAESDAETPEGLARLNEIAQQKGVSLGSFKLDDQEITAWTKLAVTEAADRRRRVSLQAEVQGVYATIDRYEIFATSVEALDQALQAGDRSLLNATNFRQAVDRLEQPNDGYFYLDWSKLKQPLLQQFPLLRQLEQKAKPLFETWQSLTLSSYGTEAAGRRGAIAIGLKES